MAWSDALCLGFEIIDEQHKSLFDCLTRLQEAALSEARELAVLAAIKDLSDYVNIHFFMEEGLMRSHDYPLLESHVLEHEALSREVEKLSHKSEHSDIFDETARLLADWLTNHIGHSDRKFAAYLHQHAGKQQPLTS
jgi:hemerythrin